LNKVFKHCSCENSAAISRLPFQMYILGCCRPVSWPCGPWGEDIWRPRWGRRGRKRKRFEAEALSATSRSSAISEKSDATIRVLEGFLQVFGVLVDERLPRTGNVLPCAELLRDGGPWRSRAPGGQLTSPETNTVARNTCGSGRVLFLVGLFINYRCF